MEQLGFFLALVVVGYISGTVAERRHYRSIEKRERAVIDLPTVTLAKTAQPEDVADAWLVTGSVVISVDYFKRLLSGLQSFVGGRVSAYETLVDRARREAVLRAKEAAAGADMLANLRLQTSTIGGGEAGSRKSIACVEVMAYATAIKLKVPR